MRPKRTSHGVGKADYYEQRTPCLSKGKERPQSLQTDLSSDSIYELLEAPHSSNSTPQVKCKSRHSASNQKRTSANAKVPCLSSSSSSTSSDFATPQSSPRALRAVHKKALAGGNADYETVSLAYENFKDNPLLDNRQKNIKTVGSKQQTSTEATALATSVASGKPKLIPPRTSLEPIPTPRTMGRRASTTSSRDHSQEIGKQEPVEPHYKSPTRLVRAQDRNVYAEPVYKQSPQPSQPGHGHYKGPKECSELVHKLHGVGPQSKQSLPRRQSQEINTSSNLHPSSLSKTQQKNKSISQSKSKSKEHSDKQDNNRSKTQTNNQSKNNLNQSQSQSAKQTQQKNSKGDQLEQLAQPLLEKEKQRTETTKKEQQQNQRKVLRKVSIPEDEKKKVETKAEVEARRQSPSTYVLIVKDSPSDDDAFVNEADATALEVKTRSIASQPVGIQYPREIPQRKPLTLLDTTKDPADWKLFVPVERKLQPDWFEDLQKKEVKEGMHPRPKSIVDGILYTSRALEEKEEEQAAGASYSLIDPEVFETYDVCRSHPKAVKV